MNNIRNLAMASMVCAGSLQEWLSRLLRFLLIR